MRYRKCRVQQHSYADEKQQAEDVANRDHIAQRLVAEFRFAQHQAREECAQRK
jgi:hypothetical protein